jgi:UDP-glucose 4-epimerase
LLTGGNPSKGRNKAEKTVALYLVTGAAGFIGSHLVDALLAAGHSVRGLDDFSTGRAENLDPRCPVVEADVADLAAVGRAMQGVDGCFHLAARASVALANEEWLETHRTNQTGTVTVLDAARACGRIPVVYASSAAVYGDIGPVAAREDLCAKPLTAYGADKLGSELHAAVAWSVHKVPTLGFRFFNVYGPRQDPCSPYSGVISIFLRQLAEAGVVTVHGDGEQIRDFVAVSDVVTHLTAGMRHLRADPGAAVLNVCTGRGTSVMELIGTLAKVHGRMPRIVHEPPRPGDIRHSLGDPTAATAMLGVRARVSLFDGLSALAALEHAPA